MAQNTINCCSNPQADPLRHRPTYISTWAFISYITLIIMMAILATFLWVILLTEPFVVAVEDASVFNYRISTEKNRFSGNFNVTVGFKNPNRMVTIKYYWVNMTVQRDNESLASTLLKPFVQPPQTNLTILQARIKCNNVKIHENRTMADLVLTPSRELKVDLRIKVKVTFFWRSWKSKRHWIQVSCSGVRARPPESITPHRTKCLVER